MILHKNCSLRTMRRSWRLTHRFTTFLRYHIQNAIRSVLGIRCKSRKLPPAPLSLNEQLGDDEDGTWGELVPDPDAERAFEDVEIGIWNEQFHDALEQCLVMLEAQQVKTIRGIFYEGLQQQKLGSVWVQKPRRQSISSSLV